VRPSPSRLRRQDQHNDSPRRPSRRAARVPEPRLMPIRAFLDGQSFDGETVRLMGIAFEMALGSLRATPDHADPIRDAVARKIIELAKAGERDPERLCEGALKDLRSAVSDPNPPRPRASRPAPPGSSS
jgi:hypothetical protein